MFLFIFWGVGRLVLCFPTVRCRVCAQFWQTPTSLILYFFVIFKLRALRIDLWCPAPIIVSHFVQSVKTYWACIYLTLLHWTDLHQHCYSITVIINNFCMFMMEIFFFPVSAEIYSVLLCVNISLYIFYVFVVYFMYCVSCYLCIFSVRKKNPYYPLHHGGLCSLSQEFLSS